MKELEFTGKGFEYFKIWIANILLTLVTLGIYYPWAKVRSKVYFSKNTKLDDKTYNYHATGKQLLLGYLIGIIIVIIYVVIQNFSQLYSYILLGLFFLSFPWLMYRSFKFNMRMTSFNNVRFSFNGKLSYMYILYLLYPVIFYILIIAIVAAIIMIQNTVVAVVGSILLFAAFLYGTAFMASKSSNYVYNEIKYGTSKFAIDLKIKEFLKIYTKVFFLYIFTMFLIVLVYFGIAYLINSESFLQILSTKDAFSGDNEKLTSIISLILPHLISLYVLMILSFTFIFAYSFVKVRSYIFENLTLDEEISFNSTLKTRKLTMILFTNLLMLIFTIGLAHPWTKVRLVKYIVENTSISSNIDLDKFLNDQNTNESAIGEEIGDALDIDAGIAI